MTPKTRFKKEGLLFAALAAAIPLLWQFTVVQVLYDANWTALFYVGNVFPTPPDLGATTYVFPHTQDTTASSIGLPLTIHFSKRVIGSPLTTLDSATAAFSYLSRRICQRRAGRTG
jgi:hypothetical protein